MAGHLPEYYFRVRENGAFVFRVDTENRQRRIEMDQIAVINIRNGQIKPHGDRELSDADLEVIRDWMEERAALLRHRAAVAREGRAREVWVTGEVGIGKTRLLEVVLPEGPPPKGGGPAGDGPARDGSEADGPAEDGTAEDGDRVVWLRAGAADAPPWRTLALAVFPDGGGAGPVPGAPIRRRDGRRPPLPAAGGTIRARPRHAPGASDALTPTPAPRGIADLDPEVIEQGLATLLPGEPRWWRAILASLDVLEPPTWRRVERRKVDRTALAWRDLVAARARQSGGVWTFVLDVEPAHPSALAFLDLLREARAPILIVRTARRDAELPADAHRLPVPPLATEEATALVEQFVDRGAQAAVRTWVPHTDATPSHLIELGRALARDAHAHDSPSLHALIGARLDRLDAEARTLLAQAALAGEEIWEGLLRTLGPDRRGRTLATLVREGMLVRSPTSRIPRQRAYRFRSELLRTVARERLPYAEHADVHVRIATWLEGHAPIELSVVVATQFERGGATDAAYAHYLAAADVASWNGSLEEMHGLYGHLAALDAGPHERAVALREWADAALRRGDVAGADGAIAALAAHLPTLARSDAAAFEADHARLTRAVATARAEAGPGATE